jgi:hypothetical protein
MSGKYMVSVCGSSAPMKQHAELSEAKAEAERLAMQPQNTNRVIHVVQVVATLRPAGCHKWED